MSIEAFILWYKIEGLPFTDSFLASPDFDIETLKRICQSLNLSSTGNKVDLVSKIARVSTASKEAQRVIIENLIGRKKKWLSVRAGKVLKIPECADPEDLVIRDGEEKWYGPVAYPSDRNAKWYIRPVFLPHWTTPPKEVSVEIKDSPNKPEKFLIRWLCFARVEEKNISLHWRSFSHVDDIEGFNKSNTQFQYWMYIPELFDEIEQLTNSKLQPINLHNLILHELWDRYRYDNDNFKWQDHRIRAEAGGVSLNARAAVGGGGVEIDVRGIHRLAKTVRQAIDLELQTNYHSSLPKPEKFDEVILKTLIQDFGALSYEFSLEDKSGSTLFRGHSYFGSKQNQSSVDSFPHINLHIAYQDDLVQLQFLLNHLRNYNEKASESKQISLF